MSSTFSIFIAKIIFRESTAVNQDSVKTIVSDKKARTVRDLFIPNNAGFLQVYQLRLELLREFLHLLKRQIGNVSNTIKRH